MLIEIYQRVTELTGPPLTVVGVQNFKSFK